MAHTQTYIHTKLGEDWKEVKKIFGLEKSQKIKKGVFLKTSVVEQLLHTKMHYIFIHKKENLLLTTQKKSKMKKVNVLRM